jgi:hypothetical protein
MVEHREVRRELVALGREMLLPYRIEPSLIGTPEQRGDDDRRECQIST